MALSGKVATLKTQLILVREDQAVCLDIVDFDGSYIVVLSARFSFGSALLFTKLASSARSRVYIGIPKLDTKVTDDTGMVKSLTVTKSQNIPSECARRKDSFHVTRSYCCCRQ